MTFTVLGFIAQVIIAAVFLIGVAAIAWGIRAAVRGWKRIRRVLAEAREIAAEHKQADLDDTTIAMLDAWKDKPGIIPDALDRDLARWLAEGDGRG